MREYVYLGPTPADEDCAQLGEDDYRERALPECRRYIRELEIVHPVPDALADLCGYTIKKENHDFGTYLEVCSWFDYSSREAADWAYLAEEKAPMKWTEETVQ